MNVVDEESSQKVREFAADTVEKVKDSIPVTINVDIRKDNDVVDADVTEANEADNKE